MTEKTRKMALILFAAVAAVILAAVPFLSRGATADPVWENYAVVEEEGKTVGIDIDDSFEGALQFDIPAGMTETNTANTQGVLTIKLDCPVAFDGSDGMLIQLATPGEGDRGIRVFLEDADGIYYILFATAASGNETFVNEDGTVSHFPRAALSDAAAGRAAGYLAGSVGKCPAPGKYRGKHWPRGGNRLYASSYRAGYAHGGEGVFRAAAGDRNGRFLRVFRSGRRR